MPYKNKKKKEAWWTTHKEEQRAYNKKYREDHLEKARQHDKEKWQQQKDDPVYKQYRKEYHKKYHLQLRMGALEHYGSVCACCGEDTYEFLSIDHIEGGGRKHKLVVGHGDTFYLWLKNNGYPKGFRVLCHNCNQALGAYRYCPHQMKKVKNARIRM